MTWIETLTDALWRGAWSGATLVILVALATRVIPLRPALRHTLWLSVLAWLLVGGFLPVWSPVLPAMTARAERGAEHPVGVVKAEDGGDAGTTQLDGRDARPTQSDRRDARSSQVNGRDARSTQRGRDARTPQGSSGIVATANPAPLPHGRGSDVSFRSTVPRPEPRLPDRLSPAAGSGGPDISSVRRPGPMAAPRDVDLPVGSDAVGGAGVGGAGGSPVARGGNSSLKKPAAAVFRRGSTRELPAEGGRATTPAEGGRATTPAEGGRATTPAEGGRATTPAEGGRATSPSTTPTPAVAPRTGQSEETSEEDAATTAGEPLVTGWTEAWHAALGAVRGVFERIPSIPWYAWLIGALLAAGLHALRVLRVRARLARAFPAPRSVIYAVSDVADALGMQQAPETLMVHEQVSPLVWCGRKTRLILPAPLWTQLDRVGRKAVLCHELAHIHRRDHWVCWLEMLSGAVFWWNPAAWWLRQRIREDADLSCDAWVTWLMPQSRRAYAEALIRTRTYSSPDFSAAPVVGMATTNVRATRFARRLKMIMTDRKRPAGSLPGLAVALTVLTLGWATLPAWSCPPEEKAAKEAAKAKVKVNVKATAPVAQARRTPPAPAVAPTAPTAPVAATPPVMAVPHVRGSAPVAVFSGQAGGEDEDPVTFDRYVARSGKGAAGGKGRGGAAVAAPPTPAPPGQNMDRLNEQLDRMRAELEAMRARLHETHEHPHATPRPPEAPAPPAPTQRRTPAPPGAFGGTVDGTMSRRYELPGDKAKALYELMAREDVPVRVQLADDAIIVHGTPAQHEMLAPFVELVRSGWEERAYKLPDSKLEALVKFMSRDDIPVLVTPRGDELGARATPREHEILGLFIELIHPTGKALPRRAPGAAAMAPPGGLFSGHGPAAQEMRAAARQMAQQAREMAQTRGAYARDRRRAAEELERHAGRMEQMQERLREKLETAAEAVGSAGSPEKAEMIRDRLRQIEVQLRELENQKRELEGQRRRSEIEAEELERQAEQAAERAEEWTEPLAAIERLSMNLSNMDFAFNHYDALAAMQGGWSQQADEALRAYFEAATALAGSASDNFDLHDDIDDEMDAPDADEDAAEDADDDGDDDDSDDEEAALPVMTPVPGGCPASTLGGVGPLLGPLGSLPSPLMNGLLGLLRVSQDGTLLDAMHTVRETEAVPAEAR
ncbi:BlaR1 peptidase M56 [Phycisphaerae bacterium RAS1]|nr:BlaR1 peptidase M56 [Phycisphaerae bacterium RAS1]